MAAIESRKSQKLKSMNWGFKKDVNIFLSASPGQNMSPSMSGIKRCIYYASYLGVHSLVKRENPKGQGRMACYRYQVCLFDQAQNFCGRRVKQSQEKAGL